MATLTLQADTPGKAGARKVLGLGARTIQVAVYTFAFDNSYPTGGEDISAAFSDFQEVLYIGINQTPVQAATGKWAYVDYSGKKLLLATNAATPAEVSNGSDQSAVSGIRLMVFGYK